MSEPGSGGAPLHLVQYFHELAPQAQWNKVPAGTRGIYVLYKEVDRYCNVIYIGLSAADIRGRLRSHWRRMPLEWTHYSVFSVWPNIRDDEIKELEGLIRHIFRFDKAANKLAVAKAYYALGPVRRQSRGWTDADSDIERAWKKLPHKGETGG